VRAVTAVLDRLSSGPSRRNLPWRSSESRYELAVAEVLLQKTKAETVVPVWIELINRYPTAIELSTAHPVDVSALVAHLGLGKQRVARLIGAARALVAGEDVVPGLGSYGRGVLGLATGVSTSGTPVDGNIARIVTRLWGWTWPRGEARKKREVATAADALLGDGAPASRLARLYALVDFGSTVCTPARPSCESCPLALVCRSAGETAGDPRARTTARATASANGGGKASDTRRI
jgi:A/G-specific adenine glycosylase